VKNYMPGMVLGILSIVSTCAFMGMPVGANAPEILALSLASLCMVIPNGGFVIQ